MLTAQECHRRSEALQGAADVTPSFDMVVGLEAAAADWMRLVILADLQSLIQAAVAAQEAASGAGMEPS